jgi:hypothetical protein
MTRVECKWWIDLSFAFVEQVDGPLAQAVHAAQPQQPLLWLFVCLFVCL